jgi:hypothetical protein
MADQSHPALSRLSEEARELAAGQAAPLSPYGQAPAEARPTRRAPKAQGLGLLGGLALTAFVAALFGVAVFMAIRQSDQANAEGTAFRAVIGDYLFSPLERAPGAAPPRVGRVVLVDAGQRKFDDLHLSLPEDLRALTPAEATTVGQIHYTREEVGRYEMGQRAIQLSCTMTVVDLRSRTVIAKRSFVWDKPPSRIPKTSNKEDVTGAAPWKEITAFLTALR